MPEAAAGLRFCSIPSFLGPPRLRSREKMVMEMRSCTSCYRVLSAQAGQTSRRGLGENLLPARSGDSALPDGLGSFSVS